MICYNCFKENSNTVKFCKYCSYPMNSDVEEHFYLPKGTMLNDRYIIGRVLGHGGFGITYLGHDNEDDSLVAIKEYLPTDLALRVIGEMTVTSFSGNKHEQYCYGLKRFLDEAKTLAKYNPYPCIVSTNDFFEANNTAYLVMEYLEGIPLNEYLKRKGGSTSVEETLEIMMPVMDALREVHKSGIIHRDISPDNIYITNEGQVKLLDFGAARFALGGKSKSLSVVLKPGYAPPEQYSTKGMQGPWTDVYAVASTMYRMISGDKIPEAMDRTFNPELSQPTNMDNHTFKVLSHALQISVHKRIQSIESFQQKLWSLEIEEDISYEPTEELTNENDTSKNYTEQPSANDWQASWKQVDESEVKSESPKVISEFPYKSDMTNEVRIVLVVAILIALWGIYRLTSGIADAVELIVYVILILILAGYIKSKRTNPLEIDEYANVGDIESQNSNAYTLRLKGHTGYYFDTMLSLDASGLTIGRDASKCQLIYPPEMTTISRVHCQIGLNEYTGTYYIIDLSTRGTVLNVRLLTKGQPYILNRGDLIGTVNDMQSFMII